MIMYIPNGKSHRVGFVPTCDETEATGLALRIDGEEHLVGFNFQNLTTKGPEVSFTFSGTYDFATYMNSVLIYLKAVSELDNENQDLYKEWIKELTDIKNDILRVNTLLPVYESIYGDTEE